jgi:hypothetical protein
VTQLVDILVSTLVDLFQVLCCFVITAPLSTTTAKYEKNRINALMKRVKLGNDDTELDVASQAAIDFLQYMTFMEPANQALLRANDGDSTPSSIEVLISRCSSTILACTHGMVSQLGG